MRLVGVRSCYRACRSVYLFSVPSMLGPLFVFHVMPSNHCSLCYVVRTVSPSTFIFRLVGLGESFIPGLTVGAVPPLPIICLRFLDFIVALGRCLVLLCSVLCDQLVPTRSRCCSWPPTWPCLGCVGGLTALCSCFTHDCWLCGCFVLRYSFPRPVGPLHLVAHWSWVLGITSQTFWQSVCSANLRPWTYCRPCS